MTPAVWPEPDAAAQLAFLQHLQRLFQEGDFSATYKYALLLALAELAIECDCADGAPLDIPRVRIAGKFAESMAVMLQMDQVKMSCLFNFFVFSRNVNISLNAGYD